MPDPSDGESAAEEPSVLAHLIRRLQSQPLLLALGFLLVLANVATASVEALRALLPAALTLFGVAVVVWLVVEIVRFRRQPAAIGDESVRVSARRISREGEVVGIDDQSGATPGGSTQVRIKADGVQGRVVGVRRGPRQP